MKKYIQLFGWIILLSFSKLVFAWHWMDFWRTHDQQGMQLLQAGKAQEAAQTFKNTPWQGVAFYRAANYKEALQRFLKQKSSDGHYNAGNALAYLGRYEDAIKAYDKAIALNANNQDAITNREIIKKLMQQQKQKQAQKQEKKPNQDQQKNESEKNAANENQKEDTKANKEEAQKQQNAQEQQKNLEEQTSNEKKAPNEANTAENTQPDQAATPLSKARANDENKKQMLRRLTDNPLGLLQQKFLRDYLRRHANDNEYSQGEN
jgi:Ca-activated chloride channel family protein